MNYKPVYKVNNCMIKYTTPSFIAFAYSSHDLATLVPSTMAQAIQSNSRNFIGYPGNSLAQ